MKGSLMLLTAQLCMGLVFAGFGVIMSIIGTLFVRTKEDGNPQVTLTEFLAHIALLTDTDFDSDEDAVRMMTLHAAKGLEFDRVIILGLEQGHLPHYLALGKSLKEIEEERRLFYVGLTRARERAALFYARRRYGRWRGKSMFLHELPKHSCKIFRTKDRLKSS